jgi:ABC-type multidrug transport system fused ATPase/permease subunit
MNQIKKLFNNFLPQLAYFYRYLRYRLLLLVIVSVFVGMLDGLGIAMFLPLLEMVSDQGATISSDQMGNLAFIIKGLEMIGFELTLSVVLFTMLFFFILKGFAVFVESYLAVVYQQFFISKLRFDNINGLTAYSYNAFVKADAGEIQNTLSGEVARVVQSFNLYTRIIRQFVLMLTYTFLAFVANPEFAALVAVGGVLSNFIFRFLYKKTKGLSRELVGRNNDFQGLLIQQVAFFKYLKATGTIKQYASNLLKKVLEIEDTNRKMGILNSIMTGAREPLMIAIVVGVIFVQVNILGGALSTIILSLLFFYRGLTAVTMLQTVYNRFLSFSGSLEKMQEFNIHLKANKAPRGKVKMNTKAPSLELSGVSFSFQPEQVILSEINLMVKPNETIALVGESGSGKTTLMNVLSGLLRPESGKLLIDGKNSADLRIETFQEKIGYITQEPIIFDDTIFNNVTFWSEKTEANLGRFWEALRQAHILTFVNEQPTKEETRLGNNGISVSGGQKQRISIARELYKEVDFLFMDEATSALDSETEKQIQKNIDDLKGQYTIIIIAHRLSTIKNADRVIVLNKGEIEQIGTYSELIQKSVSFNKMIELQEV